MARTRGTERIAIDASVLLSARWRPVVAGAHLGYYVAYWSSWCTAEVVRKRTEWIAERAARDRCDPAETRRRLRDSRERVNRFVRELSRVLRSVDYQEAPSVDLSWLSDPDDWPVMQTALAAGADILVTDNAADFPLGERRHGVRLLGSAAFLSELYARFPEAEEAIREYLARS